MDSNPQDDLPTQQASIVYCPSCGASVALPVVPPSNAGLFCDICTSPNLLVSTNDGVDWNPLSDAFNALSLGTDATEQQHAHTPIEPQVELEVDATTPTIQDEMKRRSLILSELMNFREALQKGHPDPHSHTVEESTGTSSIDAASEPTMAGENIEDDDPMANMQRAFYEILNFQQQQQQQMTEEDMLAMQYMQQTEYANGGGDYHYQQEQMQMQREEAEGMYDDPPIEYVNAHPPVQEDWRAQQSQHHDQQPREAHEGGGGADDDDDDDEEGQIYATPEQREEMRARRREFRMNADMREREMIWKKYGVGGLGVGSATS
ncbi:hypothetical protein H072_10722 [Dactylellina haptotyla CBS 200.50]|uniref:Uncharacterized protein n=1 Tax=Dactylellina haptotyla (strain CBS 200.50) TaxID=1284197 RepID=S8BKJ5_DACHA|nr:hypothetical protein H072_10722 [Dactylellina haptotyla CBS 200.50]